MINVDDLIGLVRIYNPRTDDQLIRNAYAYGREMHAGQVRFSGEEYFSHPVAVAAILSEQKLDDATIVTALLHDTIEDTKSTYREIDEKFGNEIAEMVDGVTKLTNLQLSSSRTKQAENFRKLLLAMAEDIRVLLVKQADRLHNMRTLKYVRNAAKRNRIARETMEIYAPLAERIGIRDWKDELEDLSFAELQPDARASITKRLAFLRESGATSLAASAAS